MILIINYTPVLVKATKLRKSKNFMLPMLTTVPSSLIPGTERL